MDTILGTMRALSKDTLYYLLGAGIVGLAGIVLIPLYTRWLAQTDFGVYALIEITLTLAGTIAPLGLSTTYLKWYADLPRHRRPHLLGSSLLLTIAGGGVCGALLYLLVQSPIGLVWLHSPDRRYAWTLAPLVVVEALQTLLLTDLRARRMPLQFCAVAGGRLVIMVAVAVWLVAVRHLGLNGVFTARLIGTAAGVVLLGSLSLRNRRFAVDLSLVKAILPYGAPLVWSALMGIAFDAVARQFVSHFSGLYEVAIFVLALKISGALQAFVLAPFGTAWSGFYFAVAHQPHAKATYTRVLGCALAVLATMAALLMVVTPVLLPLLAPPAYGPASRLVPWLLLPLVMRALEYWACLGIYLTHRTHWMAIVSTCGVIFHALLCWFLVPRLGPMGAAFSWLLALCGIVLATGSVGQRCYRMSIDWRPLAFAAAVWISALLVSSNLPVAFALRGGLIALLFCCAALSALWLCFGRTLFRAAFAPEC
ncbi:MAG: oligosaccharide flippase family protein [Acidobacteriia bacterium]|nr:oligosaccharide flippase family protein [Terriglobia bacterium]